MIRSELSSAISLSGQTFPLELAEPIVIDGKEVVPAGTKGMGEVVHAKKSGGSGASGELVLAARYLELGERRIRLRSLNFAVAGDNKIDSANTVAMATGMVSPLLSFVGFFVKGKPIGVPEGAYANAKIAESVFIEFQPPAPTELAAPAAPAAVGAAPVSTQSEPQGKTNEPS